MLSAFVYDWIQIDHRDRFEAVAFAYSERNNKIAIRVVNFEPSIYCLEHDIIQDWFLDKYYDRRPTSGEYIEHISKGILGYRDCTPCDVNYQDMNFYRGRYSNGKKHMLQLKFESMSKRQLAINTLKGKGIICYHEEVSPLLEMISTNDIEMIGWLNISNYSRRRDDDFDKITTLDREIVVITPWLSKNDKTSLPSLKILSMDIESMRHSKAGFTDMYDPRDYVSVISMVSIVHGDDVSSMKKHALYVSKQDIKSDTWNTVDEQQSEQYSEQQSEQYSLSSSGSPNEQYSLSSSGSPNEQEDECASESPNEQEGECTSERFDNEIELIDRYFERVEEIDPDIIIGYNIFMYDFPYIHRRYSRYLGKKYKAGLFKDSFVNASTFMDTVKSGSQQLMLDFEIVGRISIDVYQYVERHLKHLKSKTLDNVSKKYLSTSKIPLPYEEMFDLIEEDKPEGMRRVVDYCVHDSVVTLLLFLKLSILMDSVEMCKIYRIRCPEYYKCGDSRKFKYRLYSNCITEGIIGDRLSKITRPENKGGFVMEPKQGLLLFITVVDFDSLYPSTLIECNISPDTYLGTSEPHGVAYNRIDTDDGSHYFMKDTIGMLPKMCSEMLSKRLHYKRLMNSESDPFLKSMYNSKQSALKLVSNSLYGCLSSGYEGVGTFREGAECITARGRYYIKLTRDILEKNFNVEVVYGDTDSCMVSFESNPEVLAIKEKGDVDWERQVAIWCRDKTVEMCSSEVLVKHYRKPISIKFESYFSSAVFQAKKIYTAWDFFGNELYVKGIYRRTLCKYAASVYNDVLTTCLRTNNIKKIKEVLLPRIRDLLDGKVPIEDLLIITRVKSYYKGNCTNAIFRKTMKTKGVEIDIGVPLELVYVKSDCGSKTGERLRLLDLNTESIDYEYYARSQVLNKVKFVMEMYPYDTWSDVDCMVSEIH
ncbi:unnamed protein product [Sphagnum troendelagicum]